MNKFNPLIPLFIPSFSSKGNLLIPCEDGIYVSDNYDLLQVLDVRVSNSYLLSAYDIFHGFMPSDPNDWPYTDYLFIDSGGYEISDTYDLSERNKFNYNVFAWDMDKMNQVYQTVTSCTKFSSATIILSSYDLIAPFKDQLNAAIKLAQDFPDALVNFIIKPAFSFEQLLEHIKENIEDLQQIPILGLTEKELGNTVQTRLLNLIAFKQLLDSLNWAGKIHIFGGLEPSLSTLYYFAGADIFDGLSWQRMRYQTNSTLWDPFSFNISRDEFENKFYMMVDNLSVLRDLSIDLSCELANRSLKMVRLKELLNNTESTISDIIMELEG
ncbi:MAG: hypothetical protein IKT52_04930 [Oscillospiraceae bacterium]|nr:hypothetical protein [Oscillospiraceae bacterium]